MRGERSALCPEFVTFLIAPLEASIHFHAAFGFGIYDSFGTLAALRVKVRCVRLRRANLDQSAAYHWHWLAVSRRSLWVEAHEATRNPPSELSWTSAKVVVASATVRLVCREEFTMIVLNIVLLLVTLGFLCWLVFTLAVYALPLLAGVTVGLWAYETGTGSIAGILVGAATAGAVAIGGQLLFAFARPLWVRVVVAGLFAGPAAVAGYAASLGIARLAISSEVWQMAIAIIGAMAVGVTALFRMAGATPPNPHTEMVSEA